MKIEGLVYKIGTKEVKSEKFTKQDVILEVDEGPYNQHLSIQFVNDKCALLQNLAVGNKVGIEINIKGRLWTGNDNIEKCFNTLEGWKIEAFTAEKKPLGNIEAAFQEESIKMMAEENDDLPF
jgi:hypothetical protein